MKFFVCDWYPEAGSNMVSSGDLNEFKNFSPAGKVFQLAGQDTDYVTIQYGKNYFRVRSEILKEIPDPGFIVGQEVFVKSKGQKGIVVDMQWHYKDLSTMYFLSFAGKKSSRRFFSHELSSKQ